MHKATSGLHLWGSLVCLCANPQNTVFEKHNYPILLAKDWHDRMKHQSHTEWLESALAQT